MRRPNPSKSSERTGTDAVSPPWSSEDRASSLLLFRMPHLRPILPVFADRARN